MKSVADSVAVSTDEELDAYLDSLIAAQDTATDVFNTKKSQAKKNHKNKAHKKRKKQTSSRLRKRSKKRV